MSPARPSLPLMLWNVASLNIGWFACVLAAADGYNWLGPLVVAGLIAVHLALVPARRRELATLLAAAVFGYTIDSLMVLAGVFDFPAQAQAGAPSTIWMVALWVNFATALNLVLHWLQGRYTIAVLLGAIGGPMAYFGGTQFGALEAAVTLPVFLAVVSAQWAIAMPLVVLGANRIGRRVGQPVPVEAKAVTA